MRFQCALEHQCGYAFSLLQANPAPTEQNVEDNFDGNICRCTGKFIGVIHDNDVLSHHFLGYRPILEAMKTFSMNSNGTVPYDIEVSSVHTVMGWIM